ncbi:MAG: MBL fold metallo-hydrolase [Corynebacterium sp.]|nr:MBL fold metallo-hydrolase [Corynebacterium sp.]
MLLERIYDSDLAQASYFIGCPTGKEAIVVDPRRDIDVYLDLAALNEMEIIAVTETHIHADYLSGTRELAAATGAEIYISGEGGPDWTYEYEGTLLHDGDIIPVGNILLEASHTPGHTPEHLSFLVTDASAAPTPAYMLTGDFVFVGDLGRPDLLDEAAGFENTRFAGAHQLYHCLQTKFLTLPDYVQVYPAHGAGSACGKTLGAIPSSTVGFERRFAWWAPYLERGDEEGFVTALLSGQPDVPLYFGRMKRQNKQGPAIHGQLPQLREYSVDELEGTLVVDTRSEQFIHSGTLGHALAIPDGLAPNSKAASWGGWVIDPETDDRPIVVVAPDEAAAEIFRTHAMRVGIDSVVGFVRSLEGAELVTPQVVSPAQLKGWVAGEDYAAIWDVRNQGQYGAGHIPGAVHVNAGKLLWQFDQTPQAAAGPDGRPVVIYCEFGPRATVTAGLLRERGYQACELEGSYGAWLNSGYDVEA